MAARDTLVLSTFDDVFEHIGEIGKYQVFMYVIIGVMATASGFHNLAMTYVGPDQEHWCRVPRLANLTDAQQKYIAIPMESKAGGGSRYSKCERFNLDYDSIKQEDLESWNRSIEVANASTIKCDSGWVYDTSIFTSTVLSQWDLVCDKNWMVPLIGTVFMSGILVGAVGSGALGDRFGRKKVLIGGVIVQAATGVISAFVPNYYLFCFCRFLIAASGAGPYASGFIIALEVVGGLPRTVFGSLFQTWFSIGYMLLTLYAFYIRSHKYLQVALGVTTLVIGLPAIVFLPESPRWLLSVGRKEECMKILRKIAKSNNKSLPENVIFEDMELKKEEETHKAVNEVGEEKKPNITDLFRTPNLRRNTLIIWFVWFVNSLVYYGLSMGVGSLVGSIYLNAFLNALVEVPAYILTLILMLKVGRKLPLSGFMVFAGAAVLGMIPFLYVKGYGAIMTTLSLLGKMAISASFAIVYVYSAEVFPTPIRNVGLGGASSCARISSMGAPQIGPLRDTVWLPLPSVIFGGFSLAAGLLSFFLPETHNRKLPETLAEGEAFGRKPVSRRRGSHLAAENPAFEEPSYPEDKLSTIAPPAYGSLGVGAAVAIMTHGVNNEQTVAHVREYDATHL